MVSFEQWLSDMGFDRGDLSSSSSSGLSAENNWGVADYSAMAGEQYNPVINYLKKSIKRGKKEGKKGDENLKNIYAGMARGNKRTANQIGRVSDRGEDRIQELGEKLAKRTVGNSERSVERLLAENERLGLTNADDLATRSVRQNLARNQVFQTARTEEARNHLDRQNANWENYARAQSNISRMTGASQRADLQSQLQSLIFGLRGQIAQTKSEKAAAMLQAQMQEDQMMQAAQQSSSSQSSNEMAMRAGLVGNYQSDLQRLLDAQGGAGAAGMSDQKPLDLTGWAAVGDEYKGYLKGTGQHSGAPKRNMDQVMDWVQANLGKMGPAAYGTNSNADVLAQLEAMWDADPAAQKIIPRQALAQIMPSLTKHVLGG
jgi:hypothetical protein